MTQPPVVLLYDGLCGFCDRAVQFIVRRDPHARIRFAPLQGDFAAALFARHPSLRAVDSLILVERDPATGAERIRTRTDGALRAARYLRQPWPLVNVFRLVPAPIRDFVYDRFARIRYRVFGKFDACPIPTPEQRMRFLE